MLTTIAITLACLLLIVGVYAIFRTDNTLPKDAVKNKILTPHSKFTEWRENEIHYTDEGSGEIILMVHGLGGNFFNFQALNDILKNEYRVIRVDVPGMGLSDFQQCNRHTNFFEDYMDFFKTFFGQLSIDQAYVMGNSLGGLMSWMIATTFPEKVKGLVLINSAGYESEKILIHAAGPIKWPWFGVFLKKGLPPRVTNFCLSRPFADKSKVNPVEYGLTYQLLNRKGNINTLVSMATSGQVPDSNLIKNIKTPTLIIWGQQDIIIPVRHAALFHHDIPGSTVKIYNHCGHMAMMEYPEEVAEEFRKFVSQQAFA